MNLTHRLVMSRALPLPCATTSSRPLARRLLALSCVAACAAALMPTTATAACTPVNPGNGATVTCTGVANPLAPSFAATADNLTVNTQAGSTLGVLLGLGGSALTLTGNGTTLNNAGTIDPSLLGLLSLLSSGTVIGNPNLLVPATGSTVRVNNGAAGVMHGTTGLLGLNLANLTGMALSVRNGAGGTTTVRNDGSMGSSALLGVTLIPSDAPVASIYGGSTVSFTNTGTITGRVGFERSATGNSFANSGSIVGGVSMGTNSTNTFTAVSGSSVTNGGSLGLNLLGVVGIDLTFAPTGQIDGGAGGNNTLVLQNVLNGPGSGTGGAVTNASSTTYVNFRHLVVNSGTWNLQGALVSGDATINDGQVNFDNNAAFGTGTLTVNGGAIGARDTGLAIGNAILLNGTGLGVNTSSNFSLTGVLSGSGGLTKDGTGALRLGAANTYTGNTTINHGAIVLGAGASLGANSAVSLLNADATLDVSGAGAIQSIGALSGAAGTVNLGGNALTINAASNTTFGGVIAGTAGVTKQGTGTLTLAGANSYTGGTSITAGTLALIGNGALADTGNLSLGHAGRFDMSARSGNQAIAALTGTAGSQILLGANALVVNSSASTTYGGSIGGTGSLVKAGTGTLTLTGAQTYGATSINGGTLALGAGGSLNAASVVTLTTGSTFDMTQAGAQTIGGLAGLGGTVSLGANALTLNTSGNNVFGGVIGGNGGLTLAGTGSQTLTGINTYTGGTRIQSGTLAMGAGGQLARSAGVTLASGGVFDLSAAGDQTIGTLAGAGGLVHLGGNRLSVAGSGGASFDGVIDGTGGLRNTSGVLALNGINTYTGDTVVDAGSLIVGGDAAHAGARLAGNVTVSSGAAVGGFGTIGGNLSVLNGGHLTPGGLGGTLTVNGDLSLALGSMYDITLGAPGPDFRTPGAAHSVSVGGNLNLGGVTLNPIDAGGYGPGVYNLFSYGGTLTQSSGGILLSTPGLSIQNLTASKQINLVNTVGMTLNFWNANGLASDTRMGGGSGTWSVPNTNWTDATGSVTAARQAPDAFAIFGGDAGTVTVDNGAGGSNPVRVQGMQFASDGYHLIGNDLTLVAPTPGASSEIRVGDGSAGSAAWISTIDNNLVGNGLNKTGAGTLVLNGNNSYTQGTTLTAGTLSVSSDANLGASGGGLDFEGGILRITGTSFQSTGRAITFGAGGGFDIADAGNTFTVNPSLGGSGALTKLGAGTLVLSGANTYSGGTLVAAGTLQGDTTSLQGNIANNGSLIFAQASDGTFSGNIAGSGALTKSGAGTLVLNGTNYYTGGTTIAAGTLQGNSASLQGNMANNGALVFDQASDGVFNGSVSGAGSLTKSGNGTLLLNGANNYTGGTTISAGTLIGDTTSLQGDIIDNGALVFSQASDGVYAGNLSGSGSLGKTGAGTLILGGTHTYTGGTTIAMGTLQGNTSSLQGNIVDNGTLSFDQASDGTFAGNVAGSGSLTKSGAGTLTLSGTNSYAGGTTISGGTLQGDANSIQGSIVDDGALVFDQASDGSFAGDVSGSGSLTKTGAGTLTLGGANNYSGGTTITAGTLQGSTTSLQGDITDNGALIFNQSANGTFNGVIAGTGTLQKAGSGTVTLNGNNPLTGATSVTGGTLIVGDASHPGASLAGTVTVSPGATLGGIGTIGSLHLSGTVAPGVGNPTVSGNATFHDGSTYQVTATPGGQSSQITVGGTATILGGSVLQLSQPGHYAPMTDYTILTAAQGITGMFNQVTADLAFLTPTLAYGPNAVTLSLERNDVAFASLAATRNQRGVAQAASLLSTGSYLYNRILLSSESQARDAFAQLSDDVHASANTALFDDSHYVRDAINNHLLGRHVGNQGTETTSPDGTSAWTSVWGHWGDHKEDGNARPIKANGSGILVGADVPVDALRIGAAIGHGQNSVRTDQVDASAHVKANYAGLYASWDMGPVQWRGGVAYAWQRVDSTRRFDFNEFTGTASARYDANTAQAYLEGGYRFDVAHGTIEPYLNLAQVMVRNDALTEQGTEAGLSVDRSTSHITAGTAGVRGAWTLAPQGLHAYAGVGWQHAWGDRLPEQRQRFVGGTETFVAYGVPVADNAGVVDLGLRFALGRAVSADVGYHGQFAGEVRDQSARLTLNWAF